MKMKLERYLSRLKAVPNCWFALTLIFATCFEFSAQKAMPNDSRKPTILVVGTSHMSNPGRDVMNAKWDDVLTAKRQREIRQFVNILKRFKPNKIAIELPFGSASLEQKYDKYLRDEYQLTSNERDQLGLRLARELNHPKIFGIDAEGDFDLNRVFEFAKANNQQEVVDKAFGIVKPQVDELNKRIRTATITEIHKFINDQRNIDEGHQAYVIMSQIGKDSEYPGVDATAGWLKRNLTIFANLTRIITSKDDRVLVIFGVGHAKLLQQYIQDFGEYHLERTTKYF